MIEIQSMYPDTKPELYALLQQQLLALLEGESHSIPNLANTAALLAGALQEINWVGFYLMTDGYLLLGPFQGKPACIRISLGSGVCGTAAALDITQRIVDVHLFPSHIACDCDSNSEIVIPIHAAGKVIGVLDIDSPVCNRFDQVDQEGLEAMVRILETACTW
ncbi:MAG TPA: GAF domain-containing protein [Bacillota bacterium]|nr:GAF domain-containing protein [Bacillota bacterium]